MNLICHFIVVHNMERWSFNERRHMFLASFIYRRKDSYLVSLSEESEETQSVGRKNGWTCISTALGNVLFVFSWFTVMETLTDIFNLLCFPVILISIPILIIVIPEVYLNVYRWYGRWAKGHTIQDAGCKKFFIRCALCYARRYLSKIVTIFWYLRFTECTPETQD